MLPRRLKLNVLLQRKLRPHASQLRKLKLLELPPKRPNAPVRLKKPPQLKQLELPQRRQKQLEKPKRRPKLLV